MIRDIYRMIMPIGVRYFIANVRGFRNNKRLLRQLEKRFNTGNYDSTYQRELKYIVEHKKIEVFPYEWIKEYENTKTEIFRDSGKGMKYVVHKGKKLFFPKGYSDGFIKKYYLSLVMEQDVRSPHCYFRDNMEKLKDCLFMDVGAAEGIISLEMVNLAKKIILFECNEAWRQALEATFEPWREKIEIVSGFVGEQSIPGEKRITLDEWFSGAGLAFKDNIVIKLDVEGNEKSVLKGAEKLLNSSVGAVYVCTYHRQEDFEVLSELLGKYHYKLEAAEGYMLYGERGKESFRKGLIRAYREEA